MARDSDLQQYQEAKDCLSNDAGGRRKRARCGSVGSGRGGSVCWRPSKSYGDTETQQCRASGDLGVSSVLVALAFCLGQGRFLVQRPSWTLSSRHKRTDCHANSSTACVWQLHQNVSASSSPVKSPRTHPHQPRPSNPFSVPSSCNPPWCGVLRHIRT